MNEPLKNNVKDWPKGNLIKGGDIPNFDNIEANARRFVQFNLWDSGIQLAKAGAFYVISYLKDRKLKNDVQNITDKTNYIAPTGTTYDYDNEPRKSYLGTPVLDYLIIGAQNQKWQDLDGNLHDIGYLEIDTVQISLSRQRDIIKTKINGVEGTIKEYFTEGDFDISISGWLINKDGNAYPGDQVEQLKSILSTRDKLPVRSNLLNTFGIINAVVESWSLPFQRGIINGQYFEITLSSDFDFELIEAK